MRIPITRRQRKNTVGTDYEASSASADGLGLARQPSVTFEEEEPRDILATMVRDHQSFGGKRGGNAASKEVNLMKRSRNSQEGGVCRRGFIFAGLYKVPITELKRHTTCAIYANKWGIHWHKIRTRNVQWPRQIWSASL